ncbi:MAG: hypothetical protein EA408_05120 [Marinilabiliales bacterium]|nr:MAG: hypothetical protein EA408_05120 [Marinilabiliales bacterium]
MRKPILILTLILLAGATNDAQQNDFYEITRLPFTTDRFDEFAPAYYDDGIVFTTNRRMSVIVTRTTDEGENLFNIYKTSRRRSGRWEDPSLLDRSLKSNYHDGPVSFSPDGSTIFFTRNIPGSGRDPSRLGIFMADYAGGSWTNIRPFPYNSNNYNLAHPTISSDGRTLFFAGDMPGGYGGMDIYESTLQAYSWSPPVNLGSEVNSAGDEVFPYKHQGGRLYFSSNRTNGETLDLYYTFRREENWQSPVKMPAPFNSEYDDFGFIADRELTNGYFSSNREGTDNIYSFTSTFPLFTDCETIQEEQLCFVFYEQRAENVDTTTLYLLWDMGDGTRIRGLEAEHCFSELGTYTVRLDVIDVITGEAQSNVAFYNFTTPRVEQPYINAPDTVFAGQQISIDATDTYLRNFDIDEYYWELGDGTKTTGEIINHTYDYPGTYIITLGVISDPNSPFGYRRLCVYKEIVVLENQ